MTANQLNYRNTQDFFLDVGEISKKYIDPIDKIRSYINILNPNNQKILENLDKEFFLGTAPTSNLKLEQTYQESRCHAFYRLVGFPVVSDPDQPSSMYNPGLDIIFDENRTINIEKKVKIASGFLKKYKNISNAREQYVIDQLAIFANNNYVDAQVQALSGVNFGIFDAPFLKYDNTFESTLKPENQSYYFPTSTKVGKRQIGFDEFQDVTGKTYQTFNPERSHIITPFMVDPRIDLTVSAGRKVAVPFVLDDSNCKVSSTEYVQRCILEKIITDRYTVTNQYKDASSSQKKSIEYIKNKTSILDEKLLNQISSNNLYKFSEIQQYLQTLNIIYAMIETLSLASKSIDQYQSLYYWLPIPSTTGPEGGCQVNKVFSNLPTTLCTPKEDFIRIKSSEVFLEEIIKMSEEAKGKPNVFNGNVNFPLGNFTNTFTSKVSDAAELTIEQQLTKSVTQRNNDLAKANNSLKDIEIITGTFSGFGYCDMIAITGAMYVMPKEKLLGFLDDDAFARAKTVIKGLPNQRVTYREAATSLAGFVSDYYKLMDDIYSNIRKIKSG